jgi:choline dehydrogenase-like flavoprotein
LVNDSSYTFDKVLPYFQKAMTFTPPNTNARLANATTAYDAGAFGNSNGPLQVGYTNYVSVFSTIMSKALQSVGLGETGGQNSGTLIGSSYCSSTIRSSDQTRGTSSAYIRQAEAVGIDSLKVYLLTLANRILFDTNKTATGVEVQTAGVTYTLHAVKEVVVSAGAFHSPQLLMVSGVGPADTLTALDIPLVVALPGVGQNMWDHILFGPSYDMKIDTLSHVLKDPAVLVEELARYVVNAEGVFTSPVVDFIGWEKVPDALRQNFSPSTVQDLAGFPADWPEVEVCGVLFGLERREMKCRPC